jgi:hypothetical protein
MQKDHVESEKKISRQNIESVDSVFVTVFIVNSRYCLLTLLVKFKYKLWTSFERTDKLKFFTSVLSIIDMKHVKVLPAHDYILIVRSPYSLYN